MNLYNVKIGTLLEVSEKRNYFYNIVPPQGLLIISKIEPSSFNIKKTNIHYYSLEGKFSEFFVLGEEDLYSLNKNCELNTNLCKFKII